MPHPAPSRPLPTAPGYAVEKPENYIGLSTPSSELELNYLAILPQPHPSTSRPTMPRRASQTKRRSPSPPSRHATVQFVTFPRSTKFGNSYLDDQLVQGRRGSSGVKRDQAGAHNRLKHRQHRPHRSVDVHFAESDGSDNDANLKKIVRRSVTLSFAAQVEEPPHVRPRSPSTPSRYSRSPPSSDSVSSTVHLSSPGSSSSHASSAGEDLKSEKPLSSSHEKGGSGFPTLSYVRSQYSVDILVPFPPPPSARERKHTPVIIHSQSQSFTLVGGLKAMWKRASSHVRQVKHIPVNLMGQDPQRDSVVWRGFVKVPPQDLSKPLPPPPPPMKQSSQPPAYQAVPVSSLSSRPPPPPLRSSIKSAMPSAKTQNVLPPPSRKMPPPLPPRSPSAMDTRHGRSVSAGGPVYNPRNAMVFRDDMKPLFA